VADAASKEKRLQRSKRACDEIERETVLLMGLLYHGTKQHDALVAQNIFKDGLERAHKLHDLARWGNHRKPVR